MINSKLIDSKAENLRKDNRMGLYRDFADFGYHLQDIKRPNRGYLFLIISHGNLYSAWRMRLHMEYHALKIPKSHSECKLNKRRRKKGDF